MPPLTHEGPSAAELSGMSGVDVVGMLVYPSGQPQRIGIIRKTQPGNYKWDLKVLVEWQSGKKVWRRGAIMTSIDGKIRQEERNLEAFKKARDEAQEHFGRA